MNNLIKKYVDLLKKEDIINFSNKQNIILNKNELDLIYNTIKTRWNEIINDGIKVINEYKDKIEENTYKKLIELYEKNKKNYFK